jgi:hypothetical protein
MCRFREIRKKIKKESDALFSTRLHGGQQVQHTGRLLLLLLKKKKKKKKRRRVYIYIFLYACATQSKRSKIPIKKTYVKRMERHHPHTRQKYFHGNRIPIYYFEKVGI